MFLPMACAMSKKNITIPIVVDSLHVPGKLFQILPHTDCCDGGDTPNFPGPHLHPCPHETRPLRTEIPDDELEAVATCLKAL